jgi:hypothetical protein
MVFNLGLLWFTPVFYLNRQERRWRFEYGIVDGGRSGSGGEKGFGRQCAIRRSFTFEFAPLYFRVPESLPTYPERFHRVDHDDRLRVIGFFSFSSFRWPPSGTAPTIDWKSPFRRGSWDVKDSFGG